MGQDINVDKLSRQMSVAEGTYQRDVGRLFILLNEAIKLVGDSHFNAGQGDSPSPEEEEEMAMSEFYLRDKVKELCLGLTGHDWKQV